MASYEKTIEYLFSRLPMFQRVGKAAYKSDLNNTYALCSILGNPQNKFKSVHIAGTNGKGSVSHFIAAILQSSGLKVGLYTSPHLKDFRERIKINGQKIPRQYVVDFVDNHKNKFKEIEPSFFEYTFGMAIKYFSDENIDIAVIETGMGGRLDSTNVVNSIVSVITNIGFDHTLFLGNTLEKIATEKAGIIKPGVPVIIGQTQKETADIFLRFARNNGTPIHFADRNYTVIKSYVNYDEQPSLALEIKSIKEELSSDIISGLVGEYQKKNIITVLQTVDILKGLGYKLTKQNIGDGFCNVVKLTGIKGRWQIIGKQPLTICDTAHNVDGIKEITAQIKSIPHKKLHFVIGMVNDKNVDKILSLLPMNGLYYFCKAKIPRALEADELKRKARQQKLPGDSYASVSDAYACAVSNADSEDLIFIGGSTFVVAEVL